MVFGMFFIVGLFQTGCDQSCRAEMFSRNATKEEMNENLVNFNRSPDDVHYVKCALEAGANINAQGNVGQTVLMMASRGGETGVVKFLIKQKANVNIPNKSGLTALMYAINSDQSRIVKLLIEAGANVNAQDYSGNTPLAYGLNRDHAGIIAMLKGAGAK